MGYHGPPRKGPASVGHENDLRAGESRNGGAPAHPSCTTLCIYIPLYPYTWKTPECYTFWRFRHLENVVLLYKWQIEGSNQPEIGDCGHFLIPIAFEWREELAGFEAWEGRFRAFVYTFSGIRHLKKGLLLYIALFLTGRSQEALAREHEKWGFAIHFGRFATWEMGFCYTRKAKTPLCIYTGVISGI